MNDRLTLAHYISHLTCCLFVTPVFLRLVTDCTITTPGCLQAKPQAQARGEWTNGYLWLGRGHRYTAPAGWSGRRSGEHNCLNSFPMHQANQFQRIIQPSVRWKLERSGFLLKLDWQEIFSDVIASFILDFYFCVESVKPTCHIIQSEKFTLIHSGQNSNCW